MNDPIGEILSQQFAGIEESDRQMIILALAELSLRRPGWEYCTREISKKLQGEPMFDQFRKTSTAPHGGILVDYSMPGFEALRYTPQMRHKAIETFLMTLARQGDADGAFLAIFHSGETRAEVISTVRPGVDVPKKLRSIAQNIEDGDGIPMGNHGATV